MCTRTRARWRAHAYRPRTHLPEGPRHSSTAPAAARIGCRGGERRAQRRAGRARAARAGERRAHPAAAHTAGGRGDVERRGGGLRTRAEKAEDAGAARDGGLAGGNEMPRSSCARGAGAGAALPSGKQARGVAQAATARQEAARVRARRDHEVARDLTNIGNALCDLGRLDEALTAFRDAHAIDTPRWAPITSTPPPTAPRWAPSSSHSESTGSAAARGGETAARGSARVLHPNPQAVQRFIAECHEQPREESRVRERTLLDPPHNPLGTCLAPLVPPLCQLAAASREYMRLEQGTMEEEVSGEEHRGHRRNTLA